MQSAGSLQLCNRNGATATLIGVPTGKTASVLQSYDLRFKFTPFFRRVVGCSDAQPLCR